MHSDVFARLRSRRYLNYPFNAAVASGLAIALGAAPLPVLAQTEAAGAAAAQTSEQRQFNIEGGPLDGVLNRFALEAGINLSVSSELTQGKTSPGLSGQYSVNEALQQLLAGSGLTHRFTGAGAGAEARAEAEAEARAEARAGAEAGAGAEARAGAGAGASLTSKGQYSRGRRQERQ